MTGEIAREEMSGSTDGLETDALNDGTRERSAPHTPYRPVKSDAGAGRVDTAGDGIGVSVDIAASDATLDVRERESGTRDSVIERGGDARFFAGESPVPAPRSTSGSPSCRDDGAEWCGGGGVDIGEERRRLDPARSGVSTTESTARAGVPHW